MALNPFKLCTGLKFLGYFIILLVAAIIAASYYAVVILTWGPHLLEGGFISVLSFAIVIAFHVLLVLLLWCYFAVVFTDPGSVPENWKPPVEEGNNVALSDSLAFGSLSSSLPSSDGSERRPAIGYCRKCGNGKPPRCHHCSVCQRCVLKMDHHCVWVVNCVGARNYKFFILFLVYTFMETTMDTLALLPSFIKFFREAKHPSVSPGHLAVSFLAFVLNLAFALSLLCFVIMHVCLLFSNTTTVETYEKKKGVVWKYDIGRRKNFEQVFGTRKVLWLFPVFSKEDLDNVAALQGLEFPTRPDVEDLVVS
ncbi:Protein S-acyltransferase [Bertholletia excelsa]